MMMLRVDNCTPLVSGYTLTARCDLRVPDRDEPWGIKLLFNRHCGLTLERAESCDLYCPKGRFDSNSEVRVFQDRTSHLI